MNEVLKNGINTAFDTMAKRKKKCQAHKIGQFPFFFK